MEINGKRYDAISGSLITPSGAGVRTGQSIDGFRRVSQPAQAAATKPAAVREAHTPARHVTAHRPEPARTLMRSAVRKPDIKSPQQIKSQMRTDILARVPKTVVAPKASHLSVDPRRLKKANRMVKSSVVSHYGPQKPGEVPATMPPVSARPVYAQPLAARSVPAIPVSPVREQVGQPTIFEQAIANADSRTDSFEAAKPRRKKGGRIAGVATAVMSLLFVAGLFAYFNAPALSLQLASRRAGFEAKLPGYSPAGYSFGDLSYGPGNVTISYQADGPQKYAITQQVSGWDSQALLTNFVSSANKAYQTYERAGRTVYFFGNNTATWVDNGVWYTVNGNNSLSKNQLLDLAGSI